MSDEDSGTEDQADDREEAGPAPEEARSGGAAEPPGVEPADPPAEAKPAAGTVPTEAGGGAPTPASGARPKPAAPGGPTRIAGKPNRPVPAARPGAKGRPVPKGVAKTGTGQTGQPAAKAGQPTGKTAQSGAQTGQAPAATAGSGAAAGNPPKATPTAGAKPPAKPAAKPGGGGGTQGPSSRQREARERRAKEIEKRKAAEEAAAKARRQRQTYTYGVIGAVVVIGAVLYILLKPTPTKPTTVSSNVPTGAIPTATAVATPTPGPLGPEGIPVPNANPLADTSADTKGQTVNGIQCNTNEQLAYHHHAHLTIFVNGEPAQVPYGIGIDNYQVSQSNGQPYVGSGSCFYWLHTHAADGIIHIESPSNTTFSLGDFFAEWGQPLSATQVGPDKGTVTAFYNGKLYTGPDPASLPLTEHAQIQLDIATSVYTGPLIAPETLTDWRGL